MVNPTVNAVVAECYDRARAEARAATEALVGGAECHWPAPLRCKGSERYRGVSDHVWLAALSRQRSGEGRIAGRKAAASGRDRTRKNSDAGVRGWGNTTVNEVHGYTRNAFDPSRACSGSSGGSGVALACGMMPLCTGSDSGGSLRKPATFSGVSAIRPRPASCRRISAVSVSRFSVQGPMARTADDCALMLSVMAGDDVEDPLSFNVRREDYRQLQEVDLSTLRVAISVDFGWAPVEHGIHDT